MINENEKELFTLLDKVRDLNAQLSTEEFHQIAFLFGDEQEDELVTRWMQQYFTQRMQQHKEEKSEDFNDINYERIFDCVKQQAEINTNKRLPFMQVLYRIAAVLLLPLLALSAYFIVQTVTPNEPIYMEITEIIYSQDTPSQITLLDGSIVTLKSGSRLIKKNNFSGRTREIILEGEAFFDIAHNPNRPFIIHTGQIRTTVLGTSFSIKAIPGESSIIVAVVEGKVKVEDRTRLLATLRANQQFIHGVEIEHWQEEIQENVINVEHQTSWQPHDLIFSNMSFGDIVQDLAVRDMVLIS